MRNSSSCMCCKPKEFIQMYSDPPHLASSDSETAALWAVRSHCQHWFIFLFQLKSLGIHRVSYCKLCTGSCRNRLILVHFCRRATAWPELSEITAFTGKADLKRDFQCAYCNSSLQHSSITLSDNQLESILMPYFKMLKGEA